MVQGRIAYCSQLAFLAHATLQENVVFGQPFDPVFYHRVLYLCALERDLESLPAGDQTEIGERGITLSGGQKARVALARAVYSRRDVYLLDDVLSGTFLFSKIIARPKCNCCNPFSSSLCITL